MTRAGHVRQARHLRVPNQQVGACASATLKLQTVPIGPTPFWAWNQAR